MWNWNWPLRPSIHQMRNTRVYFLTIFYNCLLKNILYYIHDNITFDFWTFLYICNKTKRRDLIQSYDKRPYTHRIFFKSQFLCSVSIYSISCGRHCCSHQKFDLDLGPIFEKKNLTLAMTFEPKEIFRLQKLGYKSWFTDNSNSLCGKYFLFIPCHDLDLWLTSL